MTPIYIVAILVQVGIMIYFFRRGRTRAKEAMAAKNTASGHVDTYSSLRNTSLHVTPAQLKLNLVANDSLVYGVIMDWNIGEVLVTLAAYITGAANVYLSSGETITGGGINPEVGEMASALVVDAQSYIGRAVKVSTTDLPEKECVRFYFLTAKGIFAAQDQLPHFADGTTPLLPLFEKGNMVIECMRGSQN